MSELNEALFEAIQQNDWAAASHLINVEGAIPDNRMLTFAVTEQDEFWVAKLLDAGVMPTSDDLHKSVLRDYWDVAVLLMNHGAQPSRETKKYAEKNLDEGWNETLTEGAPPEEDEFDTADDRLLYHAVLAGDWDKTKTLLDCGAVPQDKTLILAVFHLDTEWLKMLTEKGVAPDTDALEIAVYNLPADIAAERAQVLIKAGAAPTYEMLHDSVCKDGVQNADMARILMKAGVEADEDMLYSAVDNLPAGWVKMLIQEGGVEPTDIMLFNAVCGDGTQDWETAKVLVEAGVVPNKETLEDAVLRLHANWVALLLEAGAKPTSEMLHNAVCVDGVQDWSTAEVLLRYGAVPDEETMAYARENLNSRWTDILEKADAKHQAALADPGCTKAFIDAGQVKQKKTIRLVMPPAASNKKFNP